MPSPSTPTLDPAALATIMDGIVPHARAIRHELHRHPELNYEEHRTAEAICRELEALDIPFHAGIARGTGVVAYLPATNPTASTRTIALRADIDALPIHEQTGLEYASQVPGKMHACGHDGHTAMLLGTAQALTRAAHRPNHVLLLFQPADGTMRDSAFKVHQMPSVLFFRRADHFDHERFLTGDSIPWGNDGKTADSLGIVGKRSVMLVALRLLHYLGFGTVYLLGCDFKMAPDRRYAFDEHRSKDAIRHNNVLYDSLARRFEALRPHFDQHKFRVVNCSPGSELRAFETMTYEDAVAAASAECAKRVSSQGWYEPNPTTDQASAKEAVR